MTWKGFLGLDYDLTRVKEFTGLFFHYEVR